MLKLLLLQTQFILYKGKTGRCDNRRTYMQEVSMDLQRVFFSDETVVFCTANVLFIHVNN